MIRLVLLFGILCFSISCGSKDEAGEEAEGYSFGGLTAAFREVELPYVLTDTMLRENEDTSAIRAAEFTGLLADSVRSEIFGKDKVRYTPIAKVKVPEAETYFIVKASSGKKKAALLYIFDAGGNYGAAFPFLVPDNDAATAQTSSIEKSLVISKHIIKRKAGEVSEGKDVFVYNKDLRDFSIIVADPLEEDLTIINPIDTLPRTHRFAGDYGTSKDVLVSIRDGRTSSQLTAFVHFRKNKGKCVGELKGDLFFTSSTTAVYRQGGDPCVMEFSFKTSSVTLKEEEGCGNHRDLDCVFDGTYTKKKTANTKKL